MRKEDVIHIDGAMGEGGGQVVRSSLALSILTGSALRLTNIRANRSKPGLRRQHLTGLQAAAAICGAEVTGDVLNSQTVTFAPGPVVAGDYHFDIGTAGSTTLVIQTILPPLLMAPGRSTIVVEGGTHNSKCPSFEFLDKTFGAVLRQMGADVRFTLDRPGFFPAGGGRITAVIEGGRPLTPLNLTAPPEHTECHARVLLSKVPRAVADRELATVRDAVPLASETVEEIRSRGPGNVLLLEARSDRLTTVFTAHGERGVAAERVGKIAAEEANRFLAANVPVDEHLADQLLLPMVLANGGRFRTTAPSLHTRTNADVLARFTDSVVRFETVDDTCEVSLAPCPTPLG